MFDNQIKLSGKYAEIIKKYSVDKQADEQFKFNVVDNNHNHFNIHIFETMIQTYMVAAMIGIIEGKKIETDNASKPTATIFEEALSKNKNELNRIVQYMILCEMNGKSVDEKIKNAFSLKKSDNLDKEVTKYARYGLEVIDNTFNECQTLEDVVNCIIDFRDEFLLLHWR